MAGRSGVPGSNTLQPIWVTSAFAAATLTIMIIIMVMVMTMIIMMITLVMTMSALHIILTHLADLKIWPDLVGACVLMSGRRCIHVSPFFATLHQYFGCTHRHTTQMGGRSRKKIPNFDNEKPSKKPLREVTATPTPSYHGLSCLFTGTHDTAATTCVTG